ncbi:hypothetical protein N9903_00330, partial [bacterium]|nr:hypothetical protein [bacterium]
MPPCKKWEIPTRGGISRGGELILAEGLPSTNTFSHTTPGQPWHYTQWLFGVVVYLIEKLGGTAAIALVPMSLVGASMAITLDTMRRRIGGLPIAPLLPLMILVLSASRFRFVARPHTVTFVGLALLLNL